jgi:hypothetical protein
MSNGLLVRAGGKVGAPMAAVALAGVILVGLLLGTGVPGGIASAGISVPRPADHDQASSVQEFPLWMGVPTRNFAVLNEGVVRQRRWGAYVYKAPGSKVPCIEIGALYFGGRGGAFQGGSACGPLAPPASDPLFNQSGFTIQKTIGGPNVSDTVIAVAVAANVARITVDLRPGPAQTRRTQRLSSRQSQKAKVPRLRYMALAVARKVCVAGIRGYDAGGSMLFESVHRCQ